MKFLRKLLDKQAKHFEKGGRLEKLFPLWEAQDTFLYSVGKVTKSAPHVRDAVDLKRIMITVVVALLPCAFMAMYNTGLQANLAIERHGAEPYGWQGAAVQAIGTGFSPDSIVSCVVYGALFYIPIVIVTFAVGGAWEVLFAVVRGHDINEGFLVTGMLFPLLLPPLSPLWQVALGISFGVVIAKEVFGGTGMNILNPALTARAFMFFAYPATFSLDANWWPVDGYSAPTWLVRIGDGGREVLASDLGFTNAFLGFMPGSMGETSALACLIGAIILIATGVASWRIMASVTAGTIVMATVLNLAGSDTNPGFNVPFWWHMVLGAWAFGTVFMATDPVSSPYTDKGRYVYGFLIGVMIVLIRIVNPAFPGGVMLAILLMNVFAPLIDHFVQRANVQRRLARGAV